MVTIKSKIDDICNYISGKKGVSISEISDAVSISKEKVLLICNSLASKGILSITEPAVGSPKVRLLHQISNKAEKQYTGKIIDEYTVESYGVKSYVEIIDVRDSIVNVYNLAYPKIGAYTEVFLNVVKDILAREIRISSEDITDRRRSEYVIKMFHDKAESYISQVPHISKKNKDILIGLLVQDMYGLGYIEFLISDDNLEEIAINNSKVPIAVFHKKYGWLKTNLYIKEEEDIYNYSSQIGRKSGREITLLSPIMDAYLQTGDRVTSTLFPISTEGNTITIRKFARNPWTIIDFINPNINTISLDMAALLWQAVQYEMNILIGGGTASGKTSMLNVLSTLIPPNERIISVEETREINLPDYLKWNWIPLTTREPNVEGKGGVSMLNLIHSSLRLRPDRMLVGEVRKANEAEVMFEAMHTGHSVYSTMHADTSEQIIRRLSHQPFDIPITELETLQLIIIQHRDRKTGMRRTSEITEVVRASRNEISLNRLFSWRPRTDKFYAAGKKIRLFEELNLHTGMTPEEQNKDLKEKKIILKWMAKNGINDINSVGDIAGAYYKAPEKTLHAAKNNWPLSKLLNRL
ncbi:type II/IV secretion system ATPase subunit [Candidatus Micrarchaeota archaeon]|nr:type II/IV secretion system ATPase subunit [Candidatus Micrarchaeota archaeon]